MDERTLSAAWLNGLQSAWLQHGLDAHRLFERAGLSAHLVGALPARELSDRLSHLWELAVQQTGDPLLGIRTAPRQPLGSLGLIAHLLLACPTLLEALERLCEYVELVLPTATARVERREDAVRIVLHIRGGDRPVPLQRYDFVAGLGLHLMEYLLGHAVRPRAASLTFPAPADAAAYRQAYRCPVRFDQPVCSMEFSARDLQVPLPTANPLVAGWCMGIATDLLNGRRGQVSAAVKKVLLERLHKGDPRRNEVAANMRMSERTLQRRLSDEGTHFQQMVDATRRELAQQYLAVGRMTPKEISFQLGFSDPSNFYRACRRWFGLSPRAYRQTLG